MYNPTLTPPDPIHEENGQFYFWDETWAHRYGPFGTRNEVTQKLGQYLIRLNSNEDFEKEYAKHEKEYHSKFIRDTFRNSCYVAVALIILFICFIYKDRVFEVVHNVLYAIQQTFYFLRDWFIDGKNAVLKLLTEAL